MSRKWYKDDPFVLAVQAEQVFYLKDTKLKGNWQVVLRAPPRNWYDIPKVEEDEQVEEEDEDSGTSYRVDGTVQDDDHDVDLLLRDDMGPEYVDANEINVEEDKNSINDNENDSGDDRDDDVELLCGDDEI